MKQPDSYIDLDKKLSPKLRLIYHNDMVKILDARYEVTKLNRELYEKIWPLEYKKIPKSYLKRYKVVLEKLGSLIRKDLKTFILEFHSVKEVKKEIKKWEAIADTVKYFEDEKDFKNYKKKSEMFSVLVFMGFDTAKGIARLWELLKGPKGYNQLNKKEINDICRYYNKKLK